jgi:chromosome segregation ATPase
MEYTLKVFDDPTMCACCKDPLNDKITLLDKSLDKQEELIREAKQDMSKARKEMRAINSAAHEFHTKYVFVVHMFQSIDERLEVCKELAWDLRCRYSDGSIRNWEEIRDIAEQAVRSPTIQEAIAQERAQGIQRRSQVTTTPTISINGATSDECSSSCEMRTPPRRVRDPVATRLWLC